MINEKLIERIRKLLAVANDTAAGGEHERDTAMKMAMNLLAKYNMSMADVDAPQEKRVAEKDAYHSTPWMSWVGWAIAELFFCQMFTVRHYGKNKKTFTFVGLESNVATAREMTKWLIASIDKESRRVQKQHGESETFGASFRKGAANRIFTRCKKLREEAEMDAKGESAERGLVLVSAYKQNELANAQFIEDMGIELKVTDSKTRNDDTAGLLAGSLYGDSIQLNKQLTGEKDLPAMLRVQAD